MCPKCSHFLCDRCTIDRGDLVTITQCHKCGETAENVVWAITLINYRMKTELQQLWRKPIGHA